MIIDLTNLESSIFPFSFQLEPENVDLENESVKLKNVVRVEGELKKGIVQTDVAGTISAEFKLDCTRCLAETEQALEIPFQAAFVTEENYPQAKETELGAEDLDVSVFEGDRIDLAELVREQILLNLPEQVFCSEDCKGLCEKCGANLNLTECRCEEKEIDPRWSALKNLK